MADNLKELRKVTFKTNSDPRGDLTAIELKDYIDFDIKRIYYVTNTKLPRGGHAVRTEKKIYIMMQGKCLAKFFDGISWTEYELEGPGDAIIMEDYWWREFLDFSENSVLAAFSSINYDRNLYQLDINEYIKERS